MNHPSVRRWHIIDDDGRRPVLVDTDYGVVRSGVGLKDDPTGWPLFTQFAAPAPLDDVRAALEEVLEEFGLGSRPADRPPADSRHTVVAARSSGRTLVTEPGVPFDDRFLTAASSEALVDRLDCDGIHFGHEPARGTLHLTRYIAGQPAFSWCDSLRPGPSFALEFHRDGRCTESDPRKFALARLGFEDEADAFDRLTFVQRELTRFGLRQPDPNLEEIKTTPLVEIAHEESPSSTAP